ncbi:MAG: NTP transferase domain-containing protein, partial [Chloroflexi bacterium]|nr:NTP transferase domain-containing protein [Chloroflexota bacterium]
MLKMKPVRQAVVLAGGMGTRIRPVLGDVPKLLAPLSRQSYIDWQLDFLCREGFTRILLCLGQGAGQIVEHLSSFYSGRNVDYVIEETPLGTGGALRNALGRLDERFVLLNGDTILKGTLKPLMLVQLQNETDAAILLAHVPDIGAYGAVEVDSCGLVTRFREKGVSNGSGLVSAGAYCIPRRFVERISVGPCSLERDVLPRWAATGSFHGVVTIKGFADIRTPQG